MNYILGDNEIAAKRLGLVAKIFAPSTESFLHDVALSQPKLALDLGCGPGHTTSLLAEIIKAKSTIGIDRSDNFIREAARSQGLRGISFINHDVNETPFPVGPADIIFSRYILLHLENPIEIIEKWITQLKTSGLLLLEELEQINTNEALFQKYINLLKRSLEAQGKKMFIGPDISSLSAINTKTRLNRVKEVTVSAKDAAAMFLMNMQTLKTSANVRALYDNQEIEEFIVDLKQINDMEKTVLPPVSWKLRQIAIQKI
ncbi:MAG: class I SAM-dependent methyltransferase [Thermoleophilia bacterium]